MAEKRTRTKKKTKPSAAQEKARKKKTARTTKHDGDPYFYKHGSTQEERRRNADEKMDRLRESRDHIKKRTDKRLEGETDRAFLLRVYPEYCDERGDKDGNIWPIDIDTGLPLVPFNKTPEQRRRKGPICGAKRSGRSTSGEGVCLHPAGWGTDHPGEGRCKFHGGNTPQQIKHTGRKRLESVMADLDEAADPTFGRTIDITPQEALLWEVQRTAGHVAWLAGMMQVLDRDTDLAQFTNMGIQPSVWVEMYQEERRLLIRASEAAIKAGVAERQVQVAEQQARMMAAVLQKVFRDPQLSLTPQQRQAVPTVVRSAIAELGPVLETEETLQDNIVDAEVVEDS